MKKIYPPTPVVDRADTKPIKIIDLKICPTPVDTTGDINENENINLEFTYPILTEDVSFPDQFLIEIIDLITNRRQNFIIAIGDPIYKLFSEFAYKQNILATRDIPDTIPPELVPDIDLSLSNYRLVVTGMNSKGYGPRSTFILPLSNTIFEYVPGTKCFYLNDTLAKFWHLFSETPNERTNRPKSLLIYLDTPDAIIEADKVRAGTNEFKYTCIGDWNEVNEKQYRWSIINDTYRKLTVSGWVDASTEEILFLSEFLKDSAALYRAEMARQQLSVGDPIQVKLATINPTDKKDTIYVYIIKGKSWEL